MTQTKKQTADQSRDETLDPPSMDEQLRKWLRTEGYPLEMRSAATMHAAGFDVTQSVFLSTSSGDEPREVDLVGRWIHQSVELNSTTGDSRTNWGLEVLVVAECKASRFPWVVFSTPTAAAGPPSISRTERIANRAGRKLLLDLSLQRLEFFAHRDRYGYATKRAFESKEDVAYWAVHRTVEAAMALANDQGHDGRVTCRIVIPVVVVEDKLFECYLDGHGVAQIESCHHVPLVWRHPVSSSPMTIIDVVDSAGLSTFAISVKNACDAILATHAGSILKAATPPDRPRMPQSLYGGSVRGRRGRFW